VVVSFVSYDKVVKFQLFYFDLFHVQLSLNRYWMFEMCMWVCMCVSAFQITKFYCSHIQVVLVFLMWDLAPQVSVISQYVKMKVLTVWCLVSQSKRAL